MAFGVLVSLKIQSGVCSLVFPVALDKKRNNFKIPVLFFLKKNKKKQKWRFSIEQTALHLTRVDFIRVSKFLNKNI